MGIAKHEDGTNYVYWLQSGSFNIIYGLKNGDCQIINMPFAIQEYNQILTQKYIITQIKKLK